MRHVLDRLGVSWSVAATLASEVASCYAQPHRRYHTGEHLAEVVAEVERLLPGEPGADSDAVRLAAWFHDVVYDPTAGSGANEEASAAFAVRELTSVGVARTIADEVARLVRLTAGHAVPAGDTSAAVLIDADLAILATEPARYYRYSADVRAEYAALDDVTWRHGRTGILRRFLAEPHLFHAGPDRADRDGRARANLKRELTTLTTTER